MSEELRTYVSQRNISVTTESASSAGTIASKIHLAHSTSDVNFVRICEGGARLLSPALLDSGGIKPLETDAVERTLATSEFVFLYANAFSYPSSGCGLLFAPSLEADHYNDGSATPFDSGALVNHFRCPDPAEHPRDFFQRHQLPLSEHRDYLSQCLAALFRQPFDYVSGIAPIHPGPIGITGGDPCRRSTHEVRIPSSVHIRSRHLQAVFAPTRISLEPEVLHLLKWCEAEGFDVVSFDSDRDNDFTKLKSACIEYLRTKLV